MTAITGWKRGVFLCSHVSGPLCLGKLLLHVLVIYLMSVQTFCLIPTLHVSKGLLENMTTLAQLRFLR